MSHPVNINTAPHNHIDIGTSRAREKERFTSMLRNRITQFAHLLQSTDVKEHIKMLILEPFIEYIVQRIFPYMIIAFCLFGAIFLFVILTFVLILFRKSDIPEKVFCSACSSGLHSY
jgi:hypothetical protein